MTHPPILPEQSEEPSGHIVRPEDYTPEIRAKLAQIDNDATKHTDGKRPENTRNAYEADWKVWERFTTETGLPLLAITAGTLVLFTEWCWLQDGRKRADGRKTLKSPNSIDRHLTGVVVTGRRHYKLPLDTRIATEARACLKANVKEMQQLGEQRGDGQAPALLVRHMTVISGRLPDHLGGLRDRSLMTMHFAVAGREHELAWLRERDITEDPDGRGLLVDIRVSKTAPRKVKVLYASRASICPVRSWRAYREASGIGEDPDGFAYRRLHPRWNTVYKDGSGLSPEAVGDVITRCGDLAGVDLRFTGHSPRRGLVTESQRAGHDDHVAEKQGGWAKGSKVMRSYREDDDGWEENALIGVM